MYAEQIDRRNSGIVINGMAFLKIIMFLTYNITYVLFARGNLPQSINLIVMTCFVGLNAFDYMIRNDWAVRKKSVFLKELSLVLSASLVIFFISLCIEIKNANIQSFLFTGILHILLPVLCVFFWINTTDESLFDLYFYVMICRFAIQFIIIGKENFSFSSIRSISWFNSKSSVFESSAAHDLLFLLFYFKYRKKNTTAFICMILCMLSFKRLSFILAPLCFFFYDKISEKPVPQWLLITTKVFFIISPFLYLLLLSDAVNTFFISHFGLSINKFMTGRIQLVRIITENKHVLNGFDSTTAYLMKNGYASTNMHCDVVKIYLEATIFSLAALVNNLFDTVKKDTRLFFLMLYAFIVMTTSHFLDYISAWIILYMIVAVFLYEKRKGEKPNKNSKLFIG